jgi:hypothetical protein
MFFFKTESSGKRLEIKIGNLKKINKQYSNKKYAKRTIPIGIKICIVKAENDVKPDMGIRPIARA